MDNKEILKSLIDYLIKEANNQSMSEDFADGYNFVIWLIKRYGNLEVDTKGFNPLVQMHDDKLKKKTKYYKDLRP